MTVLVCGHMNPDTDSITTAITGANLLNERGIKAKPVAMGKPTPETQFILDRFNQATPPVVSTFDNEKVFLVDTSEVTQVHDLSKAEVVGIVDHHKLGGVTSSTPLEIWVQPWGCSATIMTKVYQFYGVKMSKEIAGLSLSAILSDTVLFKSPTTTETDKDVAKELAKIAEIDDIHAYGMEIFRVKSSIEGDSATDLLMRDYKEFSMNGTKIGCGQIDVVELAMIDSIRADLQSAVEQVKKERNCHTILLVVTDIMQEGSECILASDAPDTINEAFSQDIQKNPWLAGVMSRKKQIVPNLERVFA